MTAIHAPASPAALETVVFEPKPRAQTRRPRFSEELQDLGQQFADRPARLSEILAATQGRGFDLLPSLQTLIQDLELLRVQQRLDLRDGGRPVRLKARPDLM